MKSTLIIGGGLAGCAAARELARLGVHACIVEKSAALGGRVREYGCKAAPDCLSCGLCAAATLWTDVEENGNIDRLTGARLADLERRGQGFAAVIECAGGLVERGFDSVVVATGFAGASALTLPEGVLTGDDMERLLRTRTETRLFEKAPEKVGFLLCYGSRTRRDGSPWCSQVCCKYSARAARVVKKTYPDCSVRVFYTDLQSISGGRDMEELRETGIELVHCRARYAGAEDGRPVVVWEQGGEHRREAFDQVVLSGGIVPSGDNRTLAAVTGLRLDGDGFLQNVTEDDGVYIVGTASGPMGIADTVAQAESTARRIALSLGEVAE